ncbi:calcium-binding protein [Microvirga brassicacearum]|uniref:Cadherin domain-containing protein n=1 Tax=Microvirga brassicacearum TaxID=2580413 RepID=A0A5N3P3H2_9HYPH|nr:calcium-binding protein [Microvirga brassicacearum]KAB0264267.1 hypothetical protein FEZ63_23485 [Microvirga brassicacearum]
MAVHVIDTTNPLPPVYGDGETALSIGNGDTVFLGIGAEIAAHGRNGWGIFGGTGTTLSIQGRVYSAWETAIAVHGTITIGATGSVHGQDDGIQLLNDPLQGRANILNNAGSIFSENGFAVCRNGPVSVITNSGTIKGAIGISSYFPSANGGSLTIYNTGLISGIFGEAIGGEVVGPNTIINRGRIEGGVFTGNGNDLYDGRNGSHDGQTRMGAGNDKFYGGNDGERIFMGDGDDFIDAGGGDDFLSGSSGIDVAVFHGKFSDYSIQQGTNGRYLVTDSNASRDGADELYLVEYLQFSDRTVALTTPTNSAPTSIGLSGKLVDGDAPVGTIVAQLSGFDPNGDALGYSLVSNPGGYFRIRGDKLIVDRAFTDRSADIVITVRASDPHGASLDQSFTIDVDPDVIRLDIDDPIIIAPVAPASLTLKGGKRADVLKGGAGDDRLNGGLGKDVLTGNAGDDTFIFSAKLGAKNADTVRDFVAADDQFQLAHKVFAGIGLGLLKKGAFVIGSKALAADDRIIFNAKSGALSYDADGSGTDYAAIKFAQVKAGTVLTAGDFFIV